MTRLREAPEAGVETLSELVGIANAIEHEAEKRYRWLAAEMQQRGNPETADAFETMAREEARHIEDVARWARGLGEPVPAAGDFAWRLPADLAASWDEAAGSSLLTPYRAYAIAVDNEERAFAFYAYVAAWADDPDIAVEAEKLAQEELRHAAKLRTLRRAAWRREGGVRTAAAPPVHDLGDLERLIAGQEAEIASTHSALARALGEDSATGALLDELGEIAETHAGDAPIPEATSVYSEDANEGGALRAALQPLERYSETLEAVVLTPPDQAAGERAEAALAGVIARIARISRQLEQIERH